MVDPVERQRSARGRVGAEDEVGDALVARADEAGQADDLPLVQVERRGLQAGVGLAVEARPDLPAGCGPALDAQPFHAPPHDPLDEVVLAGLARDELAHHVAVAQHRRPIRDLQDLIDVMRDEQHARPVRGHLPDQREELVDPLAGQKGRRLVEQQQPGNLGRLGAVPQLLEGADDRHERAVDLGQVGDAGRHVDADAEPRERVGGGAPFRLPIDDELAGRGQAADAQVLEDRERGDEPEVLVNEGQPQVAERARFQGKRHRPAVESQFGPWIGSVEAGHDLDEGRLPRTVLAEEAVDLALCHIEGDALEGACAAERLDQIADRQRGESGACPFDGCDRCRRAHGITASSRAS